jgi:hypothetical protein
MDDWAYDEAPNRHRLEFRGGRTLQGVSGRTSAPLRFRDREKASFASQPRSCGISELGARKGSADDQAADAVSGPRRMSRMAVINDQTASSSRPKSTSGLARTRPMTKTTAPSHLGRA